MEVAPFGQEIETGFGPATLTVFGANAETSAFFVSYYDYGEDVVLSREVLLEAERNRGLDGASAELVSDTPFEAVGYAGREIVADRAGTPLRLRVRNFLVGRRMYSLVAVGPNGPAMDEDARKFFDSFAFWEKSDETPPGPS
ncbi:hypothetical protein ABI59_00235 [Acidobacteria bacterium Mor1]|nr:hypothetical protein ABI59_00235 [Acidobacteria bacterium Mor1]